MKLSLSIPLKSFLLALASLSYLFASANSASAYGTGLSYIEDLSESPEAIATELEKQKNILKQLDLAETSAKQLFLSYDDYSKVINSQSFDYVGKCAPANGIGKYETVSCREKLLRKMCKTELMSETVNANTFCKQYFDLATSNQSLYSQKTQLESSQQMCLVLPFQVNRYKHLDNDSLKKVLGACKQGLVERDSSYLLLTDLPDLLLLRNLRELYLILKDYTGAKVFFSEFVDRAKERSKQISNEYKPKDITYPALSFLGDMYFATGEFDKANSLYLEANSIYTEFTNYHASSNLTNGFLIDEDIVGGHVSDHSTIRAYSFVGNRSRLAFIMAMKGKTNDAKKLLDESISDLEKASHAQRDNKDAIALQEIGTPLYTAQQSLLVSNKKYEEALEFADRSRSLAYLISLEGISKNLPDILSFSKMQDFAKEHKTTLVLYSIPDLPIYDYDKFQARKNQVFIWVIQPNGELNFREVDVLSALSQSNSTSGFSNINSSILIYAILILVISISIRAAIIHFPNKIRIGFAAFIGVGTGLLLTNMLSNPFEKFKFRGTETTEQRDILSNLTKDTLSAIKSRGSNKNSLFETSCKSNDCLKKLYKVLIEPIQNILPANPDEHIVFIPYRGLHRVPFASLISSDDKYLIDRHTIRLAPSIQALKFFTERAANAERAGDNYLIVGNPVMPKLSLGSFEIPEAPAQLPSTEIEAKEIAKLYGVTPLIGKDASIERVNSNLFNSRILHFATHGFLNIRNKGAGLVFAAENQEENSGILATGEFYQSRFLAEMVVLSACNTGLGVETVEGNLGLTRPFLIAGVPTVVSSLWSVPDNPTAELMIDFYKNLKNTSDKAKALRQAMLSTKKKYPDPIKWAGFTLTGLAESPKTSPSAQKVVGYMSCTAIQASDLPGNSRDLVSANLKSAPNGFTLALTEANGSKMKLDLDQSLVVVSASSFDEKENRWIPWNLSAYGKIPWRIQPDGSFNMGMSVSTRSSCIFGGKLEFIGDAAVKLQNR
jgi:CHAT domain-containing protein